jgi:hypothetical protein
MESIDGRQARERGKRPEAVLLTRAGEVLEVGVTLTAGPHLSVVRLKRKGGMLLGWWAALVGRAGCEGRRG